MNNENVYEILNLGSTLPDSLHKIINIIGQVVRNRAKDKLLPIHSEDVERTYANTLKAKILIGNQLKTYYEEKVRNFVNWYKENRIYKSGRRYLMKIIITQLPRWTYFMYFLLGFYELQEKNKIKIKFKANLIVNIASKCKSKKVSNALRLFYNKFFKKANLYNLKGYAVLDNGNIKKFIIDSADSPYLLDSDDLENCDIYFKMQCPKDLNSKGFELTPDIIIPWTDHKKENGGKIRKKCENFEKNKYKIKPLMIGTRRLSSGISYKILKDGFENYKKSKEIEKNKKLMCYFGDSKGPNAIKITKDELDVDRESQLMGYFKEKIQHPNEKRAKATKIISELEPKAMYDARIINNGNSDTKRLEKNTNLIIPIDEFCNHIASFQYNLNISGYRKSIPNRFIESFISGTGIVTDKLYVKWYRPFEKEVFETVSMGYLKDEEVNWNKFREDILDLPEISKDEILYYFNKKWSPMAVCTYIIDELSKV